MDAAHVRNPGFRPPSSSNPAAELAAQSVRAGPTSPPNQQRQAPPGFASPADQDEPQAAGPPQTSQHLPAEAMLRAPGAEVHAMAGGALMPNGVATGEQAACQLSSDAFTAILSMVGRDRLHAQPYSKWLVVSIHFGHQKPETPITGGGAVFGRILRMRI